MVEIAGTITTLAPNARLVLLLGVLLAALSLGAWAQATGLSDRCRDRAQVKACPETCAAECANGVSSEDIRACIHILVAVRRGEKDRPSCHGSGPMPPADEPVPNDIALGELKELCVDPQFAKVCPKTCYPLCDGKALRKDQLHTCQLVLQATLKGAKDRPSCQRQASGYAACKQRVAEHFKDFTPPSPPEGPLESVYETRPPCATPLKKLLANFICLRDESRYIFGGVQELEERGLSGINDIKRLCSLGQNELGYYTGLSERLIRSGRNLKDEFETLESCRKGLISWNRELKAACPEKLPNCMTIVTNLEKAREPMMAKIGTLATGMEEQLDKVELELDSIRFFKNAALDCLPPSLDGGEPSLKTILSR